MASQRADDEPDDDVLEAVSALPDLPFEIARDSVAGLSGSREHAARHSAVGSTGAGPAVRLRVRCMRSNADVPALDANAGSPDRLLGRILVMPLPWVQAGGVAEKDPGESAGQAFISAFIRFGGREDETELLLGDYSVRTGSGILLGRGALAGPGVRLFRAPATASYHLKPQTSADEKRYFRGLAVRLPIHPGQWSVDATLFASSKKRGASEPDDLKANRERVCGTIVSLRRSAFRMEFAGLWTGLDHPIAYGTANEGTCRSWTSGSIGVGVAGPGFELSGEAARSRTTALTFECRSMPSGRVSAVLQIQSAQPGFLAPYGLEGSGGSAAGNMTLCKIACQVSPGRWAKAVLTASLLTRFRAQPGDPAPPVRARLSAEAELFLTPAWSLSAFAGDARADGGIVVEDADGRALRVLREDRRSTLRIQSVVDAGGQWSVRNRCELVSALRASQGTRECGVLLQADVRCRFTSNARASFRTSLFSVNGWGARVYSPEEDVEGATRIPVFTGRGVRMYALLRWSFIPAATLSCRWGTTFRDTIPRGQLRESDAGEDDSDLSLQLDLVW